jgi:hypothetical protein
MATRAGAPTSNVTASVLGACAYAGLNGFGVDRLTAMTAGFLVTFVVRGLAIRFGWSLPVLRRSATREGRSQEDRKTEGSGMLFRMPARDVS